MFPLPSVRHPGDRRELALPLLIAKIIDDGIMAGNLSLIYRVGVYMLILAPGGGVPGAFGAKFGSYGSIGIGANLRKAEFDKISHFSFGDIDHFSSASLITRLTNDITNIQNFTMMMIRMLFRTLTQIVVSPGGAVHHGVAAGPDSGGPPFPSSAPPLAC